MPLAVKTWGLDGAEIDKGIDGPNVAAVHFKFESLEALGAAMGAAGTADVLADVAELHLDRAGASDQRDGRVTGSACKLPAQDRP